MSLSPGAFLVLFADGDARSDPSQRLHTGFKLGDDGDGDYLALLPPGSSTPADVLDGFAG